MINANSLNYTRFVASNRIELSAIWKAIIRPCRDCCKMPIRNFRRSCLFFCAVACYKLANTNSQGKVNNGRQPCVSKKKIYLDVPDAGYWINPFQRAFNDQTTMFSQKQKEVKHEHIFTQCSSIVGNYSLSSRCYVNHIR